MMAANIAIALTVLGLSFLAWTVLSMKIAIAERISEHCVLGFRLSGTIRAFEPRKGSWQHVPLLIGKAVLA